MTPEAATLRDVAIALGVDPSGDVLVVARQAAAAAREVDTAMLVLAAVDEPAEPLVAAIRRLLRERDEARAEVEAAERRGYNRAIAQLERALAGEPRGVVDTARAGHALDRVAALVDAEIGRAKCCAEMEAEVERLRAEVAASRPVILAGIDALGSTAADVEARNAARDALHALGAGEAPAAVLTAAELAAVRGVLRTIWGWRREEAAVDEGEGVWERATRAYDEAVQAIDAWDHAGRPLAGEESE